MDNKLEKKFGLPTAISMVIGIVIGSGVFFKAVKVLSLTGGSMGKSILVIAVVGLIMIICSCVFAELASKYEKVNGVVDYAEVALGPTYAYYVGWFMSVIYYPVLSSCLAWVAAQYTCMLFGFDVGGGINAAIGAMFLMLGFGLNTLAPKLAGRFQVSTTIIKLIPLCLMAVVGIIAGLTTGATAAVLSTKSVGESGGMLSAVCAFAFAYEGWIIATSINAELRDAKKNLPRALIIGSLVCTAVYCLYVFSMSSIGSVEEILAAGDWLPKVAFSNLFGDVAGTVVFVFIIISCLGTMNGLIMGNCRGVYSISVRNMGPTPSLYSDVDRQINMPVKSAVIGMMLAAFWYFYWQVCFFDGLVTGVSGVPLWFNWESDEIVIITLYACYIPMFIALMAKAKDLGAFRRFILPALGILACAFMVYCGVFAYGIQSAYYLVFFTIVMFIGFLFKNSGKKQRR